MIVLKRQNFDRSVAIYRLQMGQTLRNILLDEGRLLVRDLIKLTPPRGTHPLSESFGQQRKLGLAAVERDVKRVLRPLDELEIVTNARNQGLRDTLLQAAGIAGGTSGRKRLNFEQTERLLRRLGLKNAIARQADAQIHRRARGSRGRVPKGTPFTVIVRPLTVKRYVREAQKAVGRAKKGWMAAALALGVKGIPNWVSGNPRTADGAYRFDERDPYSPAITAANQVPYAGDFQALSIVQYALELRQKNMVRKAQRAIRALHAKRL